MKRQTYTPEIKERAVRMTIITSARLSASGRIIEKTNECFTNLEGSFDDFK